LPHKIIEFHTRKRVIDIVPGFLVEMAAVPPSLPLNHEARRLYDDRSIDVPNVNGSLWIWVRHPKIKGWVAQVVFVAGDKSVLCDNFHIDYRYRCMGVAATLCDFAADYFELPVHPSYDDPTPKPQFGADRLKRSSS